MKRSLHFKIIVVLGYVALCTMLVLADQQSDLPVQGGQQAATANYE
jgi:hypothetical protein